MRIRLALLGLLLGTLPLAAQVRTPAAVNGGIYLVSPPSLANNQQFPFTFDVNGNLRTTSSGGGGGGSVTQGTVPWVVSVTTWAAGTLGAMANYGTSPGAVLVPGVNAFVTNPVVLGAGATSIGKVGPGYTSAQTPLTASATGTTAATTATLAGTSAKTTYICGWSIDADATAATVGDMTVTGIITGTLTRRQGAAAVAAGTASTWQVYSPCLPANATNTSIAVVSIAAGTGGHTDVNAWGYQE